MSWITNLAARVGTAIRAFKGMSFAEFITGSSGWWKASSVTQRQLMQQYRGWVFKCVRKIAEKIGVIKIRLYRKNGKGSQREWEELEEHPIIDLLNAPNDQLTRSELFQMWSMHDDLAGNAYWLLEDVKNAEDEPTSITVLNPANMEVVIKDGRVFRYKYQTDTTLKLFEPYQIVHFRCPNPNNPFIGIGPTEGAIDAIEALNWAQDWNKKFFQNAGRPGLILETDQVDEKMIKLLRDTFDDRFAGAEKAHRTAVLPSGVKVSSQSGTSTQKDMDFTTLLTKMRDEILAAFGAPAVILGLGLGETMNRASAETLEYVFSVHTIEPKMRRFIEFLNVYLVSRYGDDLVLDFDSPVPANVEMQIRSDESALNRAPYKSVNEVRAERGLPPISGGDSVMGSALAVPVGEPEKAVDPGSLRQTQMSKSVMHATTASGRKAKPRRALAEKVAGDVADIVAKHIKATKAEVKDLISEDWEPRWDAMVKRVIPFEDDMKKQMALYAVGMTERAERNIDDAIKSMANSRQKATVDIDKLLDKKAEVAIIIKTLGPIFQKILETEGAKAADMVGEAFDAQDERIQDALAKGLELMAAKYSDETLTLLEETLLEGIEEGDGLRELKKRVQQIGEFSASTRAETVAKTEAFRVANFSTKEAWKQTGVVKEVKWYTAKDEMVCPFCSVQDGEVVGIEENFYDKGDTVEGADDQTMDVTYSAVEAPPLHPNCRCYIRPETIET